RAALVPTAARGVDVTALKREFPAVDIVTSEPPELPFVAIDASAWRDPRCSTWVLDAHVEQLDALGPFAVHVSGDGDDAADVAFEVLTRYQRFIRRTNEASNGPVFARLLDQHAALFDAERPLGRSLRARGLDTWQWALRLCPTADLGLQLAALVLP